MNNRNIIKGFSKLSKEEKLEVVSQFFDDPLQVKEELATYWHKDEAKQKLFDEFSENTISNFFFPFGVAPNFIIDGKSYMLPMVIEESSVIAAASKAAKFWSDKGGFHTRIVDMQKLGQVHFIYPGDKQKLYKHFSHIKRKLIQDSESITANMRKRGGGILDIELVDMTPEMEHYYQLKASFNTVDSMGANFINSCLEEFGKSLKAYIQGNDDFVRDEKDVQIIMAILSNYTPDCLVEAWVECDIKDLDGIDDEMTGETFARKFSRAIKIAEIDVYRATTHNKGIFNGIDALALATGNDFRAIEACGHTYASREGKYQSLTSLDLSNGKFKYILRIPLTLGTVGGLTSLHPLAKRSLELLGNPDAKELMKITAVAGLANNFSAVKSLITKGIQSGHMKMHLFNILNSMNATKQEKEKAAEYFKTETVSVSKVQQFLNETDDV